MKVGLAGWSSIKVNWRKKFKSKLQAYSSLFSVIEINTTFYKIPKEKTIVRWRSEVNEIRKNFEFILKLYKGVTHEDKFEKESYEYLAIYEKYLKLLDGKILLLQTPKSFKDTKENFNKVKKFLNYCKTKVAIELRGFSKESIKKLLKSKKVLYVFDPFVSEEIKGKSKEIYLRLHGYENGKMYYHKYSKKELLWLKEYCKELEKSYEEIYIIFNNIYMFENAIEFLKIIKNEKG